MSLSDTGQSACKGTYMHTVRLFCSSLSQAEGIGIPQRQDLLLPQCLGLLLLTLQGADLVRAPHTQAERQVQTAGLSAQADWSEH